MRPLKGAYNYSAASSVASTSSTIVSLTVSEASTFTATTALTFEVNLTVIVKLPTLLIGLSSVINFLSTSTPQSVWISSASFLVVIVPNNFPLSPAFAESLITSSFSIFSAVSSASACNFSALALILAISLSRASREPFVATCAKLEGSRKFLA